MHYSNSVYKYNSVKRLSSAVIFSSIIVLVISLIQFNRLHAAELNSTDRSSYSIDRDNKSESNIDINAVLKQRIQQAPALITNGVQLTPSSLTLSNRIYIGDFSSNNQITTNSITHGFSIFDARVNLLSDDDYDGYYHYFSVNFDADVDVGSAIVYARMYISYEGGPWNHYYTTKTFDIIADSDFDVHTVDTVFSTGYPPGSYDIRIDLYEAGWTGRVAVYGPNDDYDLSYIPLEDEEHEYYIEPYVDVVDVVYVDSGAGCSLNSNSKFDPLFPILFFISFIYFVKRKKLES